MLKQKNNEECEKKKLFRINLLKKLMIFLKKFP